MHIAGHAYSVLSPSEIELIHRSALRILDEMGMEVQNDELLQKLAEHGLRVDFQAQRVRFPPKGGKLYRHSGESYYKWTQWFFLKFYHAGLAYRAKAPVNWCPRCQTVLANEQVIGEGVCERCSTPVTKKELEQWFFRITRYADELLDHSRLDWPERIKTMQKNWVGKSEGAEILFRLEDQGIEQKEIRVFTTRPYTIFGVTFFLLAPEPPLVARLTRSEHKAEVDEYIAWCRRQTEYERVALGRE